MSRQKAWSDYNQTLRRILDSVKDPGTEIEGHGITKIGGVTDQFHYLDYLESGEVMTNVQDAMRRGFDAFLIGNIGVLALVKTAEAVVKLNRTMGGGFLSKRLYYAPPMPDQIDEIRKYYGNIYPTVASPKRGRKGGKRI
jgi:hypothetical protein